MLDPGRYLAEAIYFLQYVFAQILWALDRALLSIALIADGINVWLTTNVGYLVELLTNTLSAPLGGMFILALTALGLWYALNNIVATERWIDPSKFFYYSLIAFFFFSSPVLLIDLLEEFRTALNIGIQQSIIDNADGNLFGTTLNGSDTGLPSTVGDINSDGTIGSLDLVASFIEIGNGNELDNVEFPVNFEAIYFPFGDPANIDLSDEADQEEAKSLASAGIQRLIFSLLAIPTAIAEHFLLLSLTSVAVLLYAGIPFALLFAFFLYTQAFIGAYIRQFINLLVETFLSIIIASLMVGLLLAAAQAGVGLYIGASLITLIVLTWRILSALKLASAAFDLFGGGVITGGAGGRELATMAGQATVGLASAAVTGGATVALGGTALAATAMLRADDRSNGTFIGADPSRTEGRVRQLKSVAGYALGKSETTRRVIEGAHEIRTLARNFRDGESQSHIPDTLDYFRAGASMSGFGSSPWLAMRLSPSLRTAFDEIGGNSSHSGHPLGVAHEEADGAPVRTMSNPQPMSPTNNQPLLRQLASLESAIALLHQGIVGQTPTVPVTNGTPTAPTTTRPSPTTPSATAPTTTRPTSTSSMPTPAPTVPTSVTSPDSPRISPAPLPPLSEASSPSPPLPIPPSSYPTIPLSPPSSQSRIRLERQIEPRRERVQALLAGMAEPNTSVGQFSHETVAVYAGTETADHIQTAIQEHSVEAVQQVATDVANQVQQAQIEGVPPHDILANFQSQDTRQALRQRTETPLTDTQLTAVADMVLLPKQVVSRQELFLTMANQVQTGTATDESVAQALGSPTNFGGQTGVIRGALRQLEQWQLPAETISEIGAQLQSETWQAVRQTLAQNGLDPQQSDRFIQDVSALPSVMQVPQTTATTERSDS